jgi:hypothetical protein
MTDRFRHAFTTVALGVFEVFFRHLDCDFPHFTHDGILP